MQTQVQAKRTGIAHFQKEWQTWAKMSVRSIMGSFGGAIARAKTFSLTQIKFQFNNGQKFKYCLTLKRMKILKQCRKVVRQKHKPFGTLFLPFCFSIFKVSDSVLVLLRERKIVARAILPPNDSLMNDFPLIGDPSYAQRILGSPGGKHCKSLEGNVRSKAVFSLKTLILGK